MRRLLALTAVFAAFGTPVLAQAFSVDLGSDNTLATRSIELLALVTVLSIVPGLAVMVTCFPFIVTVLSILRQALGLQQSPPNIVIVSLALFLTWFVMDPVFTQAWSVGVQPFTDGQIDVQQAIPLVLSPFRGFMAARVDPDTFTAMQALRPGSTEAAIRRPSGP